MQHALPHLGNPGGPGVGSSGAAATAAAAAAAAAAACWLPPADVILTVGGRPFAAHRAVLSAHSGYLKALLVASDASVPPPTPTISVPNVSPDSFAPLLAFMYSGFLDLGPDNIYGVLLAAHLLHMPRALAFCRAFLLHQQQRRTALPILKPIPSRKMLPVLVPPRWPPSHRPSPHSPPHLMHTPEASPFRAVISTSSSSSISPGLSPLQPTLQPPVPPPILHVPFHPERPYSPPIHHADPGPSNPSNRTPSSLSPCPSSLPSSNSPSPITSSPSLSMASNSRTPPPSAQPNQTLTPACPSSSKAPSTSGGRAGTGGTGSEPNVSVPSSSSSTVSSTNSTAGPKVVLDVACCDGPVRFHRVLNDNYGLELGQLLGESVAESEGGTETLTVVGERPVLLTAPEKGPVERPSMGQDVGEAAGVVEGASRDDSSSVDVDSISSDASKSRASTANTASEPLYRCLYCNHTFKSHYCYQKHTRRHINPVALELGTAGAPGCGVAGKLKAQVVVKEVKLLDMNVQYYPCKTCGSKFPSYYFVHKHRKMCHAGEIGEGGAIPNQPQQQNPPPQEGNAEGRDREGTAISEGGKSEGGGEGEASGCERKFAPVSEASLSGTECQPKIDFSPVFKSESGGGKW
ncbi:B-cell CLL/lymphoma 6 member B protein [Hetaerina americana]|uniref:B-cell CLL/lymphoma 6 member B protein n=1 Tax=Hetaerina americana TaxID=62018 RepID=UPI003A7F601A